MLQQSRQSDTFIHEIDAAIAEIGDGTIGRELTRIDGDVCAHAYRRSSARTMEVRRYDRTDTHELQSGDHTETDRAATDHERSILLRRATASRVLETDRERLGHRSHVILEVRGDLQQGTLVEQHELSPAARTLVAEADHGMPAGMTHHGHGGDSASGLHGALAAGSVVDDFADVFVTGNEGPRKVESRIRAAVLAGEIDDISAGMQEMLLRRAQSAAVSAHQRLTLTRNGIGHVADEHLAVLNIGCFHGLVSSTP